MAQAITQEIHAELTKALERGDLNILERHVDQDVNLGEYSNDMGFTALQTAIFLNKPDVVKFVLAQGVDPEGKGKKTLEKVTPLQQLESVAGKPNAEIATQLITALEKKYRQNLPDLIKTLNTAAASARDMDLKAQLLMARGRAERNQTPDEQKSRKFYRAAYNDDFHEMKSLYNEGGIDVDYRDDKAALHAAIQYNYTQIVEFLLSVGADANIKTTSGDHSAFAYASYFNQSNAVKILVRELERKYKDDPQALITVLEEGYGHANREGNRGIRDRIIVPRLEKAKAEVKAVEVAQKNREFFAAARAGKNDELSNILQSGQINLDMPHGSDGWTALHAAAHFKQLETVKFLLARGADPNAKAVSRFNVSPLYLAAGQNAQPIAKVLITALEVAYKDDDQKLLEALGNDQDSGALVRAESLGYSAVYQEIKNAIGRVEEKMAVQAELAMSKIPADKAGAELAEVILNGMDAAALPPAKSRQILESLDKVSTLLKLKMPPSFTRQLDQLHRQRTNSPIILTTAFTGVRYHPDRLKTKDGQRDPIHDSRFFAKNMPLTASEIANDARQSFDEGSRFMHVHARNPFTGRQSGDAKDYIAAFDAIRKVVPGVLLSGPTSRKEEVGDVIAARMAELESLGQPLAPAEVAQAEMSRAYPTLMGKPDFITMFTEPDILNEAAIKEFDSNHRNGGHANRWPETIREYFSRLAQATAHSRVTHEVEVTNDWTLRTLEKFTDNPNFKLGIVGDRVHAVVLLGFSSRLPIEKAAFQQTMADLTRLQAKTKKTFTVSVGAVIMPQYAMPFVREHGDPLQTSTHDYREVIEWVVEHNRSAEQNGLLEVHAFRTGLEDSPVMYGKHQTNSGLVKMAKDIFAEHEVGIITDQKQANYVIRDQVRFAPVL